MGMLRYRYLAMIGMLGVLGAGVFFLSQKGSATLATVPAVFDGVSLNIQFATTTADREKGLGGRSSIPNNYGMLFIFPKDSLYGFWMKDMLAPIDMYWLDSQGHVVFFLENVATSSYPNVFYPTTPARYVLETAAGFSSTHQVPIREGSTLLLKNFPVVSK